MNGWESSLEIGSDEIGIYEREGFVEEVEPTTVSEIVYGQNLPVDAAKRHWVPEGTYTTVVPSEIAHSHEYNGQQMAALRSLLGELERTGVIDQVQRKRFYDTFAGHEGCVFPSQNKHTSLVQRIEAAMDRNEVARIRLVDWGHKKGQEVGYMVDVFQPIS